MQAHALVHDWMTPHPVTVRSGLSLAEARAIMERDDIRRLLVVDGEGVLIGVLSWRDLVEAWPSRFSLLSPAEIRELMARVLVDEIMTIDVITVDPDTSIAEAVNLMFEETIGALPVVDDGRVVGILTNSDLLRGLVRLLSAGGAAGAGA